MFLDEMLTSTPGFRADFARLLRLVFRRREAKPDENFTVLRKSRGKSRRLGLYKEKLKPTRGSFARRILVSGESCEILFGIVRIGRRSRSRIGPDRHMLRGRNIAALIMPTVALQASASITTKRIRSTFFGLSQSCARMDSHEVR
jgi:hypothetical protein